MQWPHEAPTRYEAHYGDRLVPCYVDRPASIDQLLRDAAARSPDAEALVDGDRRVSYREFDRIAGRVAAGLSALGLAAGDRVALLLGNRMEFAFALMGALRLGAIVVPLNTREQTPEIAFNLSHCGAKAIIHEASLTDRLPKPADTPSVGLRVAVGGPAAGSQDFDSLLAATGHAPDIVYGEEDTAVILYTSGTTGKPKGAMLTQMSIVHSVLHYQYCWGLNAADRALMAVPATHVTGLVAILLSMVRVGGATIFQTAFKAADFLALMAAEKASYTLMVPAMYNLCLLQAKLEDYDLRAWRVGGYGGSPMPIATVTTLAEKLPQLKLVNAYGSTETSSPSSVTPPGAGDRVDTVGRPVPCALIKIIDDDGRRSGRGRKRRDLHRRRPCRQGLLGRRGGHRQGLHCRLLAVGRHRRLYAGWLSQGLRPQEGHDQPRRLQGLFG